MASNISIDLSSLGISWSLGESYRVAMDQGFVFASTGLKLPVSGNTNLRTFYAANTAPTITSTYPINYEASSLENQVIDLGIDRDSFTSNDLDFHLYKIDSPNVLVKSFTIANTYTASANNSVAGISGGNIKLPINLLMDPNTSYYVLTDANVVQDADYFAFAGISTSNIWTWTTSTDFQRELTNPVAQSYFEDGNTAIASSKIIKDVHSVFGDTGTYTVEITSNISNSVRQLYADADVGTAVWSDPTLTITGSADQVNTRLDNLLLIPEDDYTGNITLFYELTTPGSNVYTQDQSVTNAGVNEEFGNVTGIARSYYKNTPSTIFANSTPYIDDGLASQNINNYEITIDTFGQGNVQATGYSLASNITITGTKDTVNSVLSSVEFWPNLNLTSNVNIGYTQTRNGTAQTTSNIAVNYLGVNPVNTIRSFEFLSNTTFNWSSTVEEQYYADFRLEVVGGGGGGVGGIVDSPPNPSQGIGGGGGGGYGEAYTLTLPADGSYPIVVGAGGTGIRFQDDPPSGVGGTTNVAGNGGASSAFGYTAAGGSGGSGTNIWSNSGNTLSYNWSGGQGGGPGGAAGGSVSGTSNYSAGWSPALPTSGGSGGQGGGSLGVVGGISSYYATSGGARGNGGAGFAYAGTSLSPAYGNSGRVTVYILRK